MTKIMEKIKELLAKDPFTGKRKKLPQLVISGMGFTIVLCLMNFFICDSDNSSDEIRDGIQAGDSGVQVYTVQKKDVAEEIDILGQIIFREKVSIASKIEGRIHKIQVDAGDKVRKGQLIAQIERLPLEIQLKQQKSELDIAKRSYDLTKAKFDNARKSIEIKFKMIIKARAEVHDKKVTYENMDRVMKNKMILYNIGGISKSEIKSLRAQHTTVYTKYELAKADFEIQMVGFRDEDISSAGYKIPKSQKKKIELLKIINTRIEKAELEASKSKVLQAENNVRATEIMLKETNIRSPINGIIATKNMEAGEMIKSDSIIAVVMNIASIYIALNINEKDIRKVKLGQNVRFTVDALGDKDFSAVVRRISPVLDVKTRTIEIKAEMVNKDMELVPGMFARAKIEVGSPEKKMTVPASAVAKKDGTKATIYLVKKGIVFKHTVSLGKEYGEDIEVINGLKENDTVVAKGVHTVYAGMAVNISKNEKVATEAQSNRGE